MARRVSEIHVHLDDGAGVREELRALLPDRRVTFVDDATLAACLPEVEVLICGYRPNVAWSRAERLRLVHFLGAGVDGFWPAEGLAPDVVVANARGIHAAEMRDHTLAMILAFERDLLGALERQRARSWERAPAGSVTGKTVAVLGLGEVGRPIVLACSALGMHVIGVCAEPRPVPGASEVLGPRDLGRALEQADYAVVALPLTSRTRGSIDAVALAKLRPHAVLVVISRGDIVDEAALAGALSSGRLRGAALDVFRDEPLPASSPLWEMPNVIVTPHIAGWMPGYLRRALLLFQENLARIEADLPVLTPVERTREY